MSAVNRAQIYTNEDMRLSGAWSRAFSTCLGSPSERLRHYNGSQAAVEPSEAGQRRPSSLPCIVQMDAKGILNKLRLASCKWQAPKDMHLAAWHEVRGLENCEHNVHPSGERIA